MTERKKPKKPVSAEKVLQRLAALCARSEQCSADIRRKLDTSGLSAGEREEIMSKLVELKFVDDLRYARSLARDKVRFAGWGKLKIRAHLYTKRLDADTIREAMAAIEPADYKEALLRVARAKGRTLDMHLREDRDKLLRHIVSRGFEPPLAIKVMEAIAKRIEP